MLILVGSSQEKGSIRNPFDISTRIKMIEAIYPDRSQVIVHALPDYSNANDICTEWGRHVIDNIKQHLRVMPDVFIYGDDQRRSEWFLSQQNELVNTAEFIIPRARTNISATQMREWLFLDEFNKWAKFANPKLRKHYDELRAELLNCKGLEAIIREKLRRPQESWSDKPKSIFDVA